MKQPAKKRDQMIFRWVLFVAMTFTAPIFYYLFMVGGVVTYAALAASTFPMIFHLKESYGFIIVNGAHLFVYGILFFVVSGAVSKWLCRLPARKKLLNLTVILAILLGGGWLRIFGLFGHASEAYRPQSAYYMGLDMWSQARDPIARTD